MHGKVEKVCTRTREETSNATRGGSFSALACMHEPESSVTPGYKIIEFREKEPQRGRVVYFEWKLVNNLTRDIDLRRMALNY